MKIPSLCKKKKQKNSVLNGLDSEYNALVDAISGCIDQGITLGKVYSMLLTTEARLQVQNACLTRNVIKRGRASVPKYIKIYVGKHAFY
jgi:hypothetical protein